MILAVFTCRGCPAALNGNPLATIFGGGRGGAPTHGGSSSAGIAGMLKAILTAISVGQLPTIALVGRILV